MKGRTPVVAVVGLFLVFILSACGSFGSSQGSGGQGSGETDEYKIGITFPLSGSLAELGQESLDGAEVAIEMVNDEGGIDGKEVTYVSADTPDASTGVSEANRLISQEGVSLIYGTYSSSIALAISEVTEKNQVVYWEEAAVDAEITDRGYNYVLRSNPTSENYGDTAATFAAESVAPQLGIEPTNLKVAILSEDSSYGQAVGSAASSKAEELGMQVVENQSYNKDTVDLSSVVLTLKQAQPDVIIATQYLNDSILFAEQARDLGLNMKALIGTGAGHSNQDFVDALGEDAEGVLNVSTPSGIDVSKLPEETQEVNEEFESRYEEKYGAAPGLQAQLSFSGMWILLNQVLPEAGGMDPDRIVETAKSQNVPEGYTINGWGAQFDENGQNTRAFPAVMQWQGGKLRALEPDSVSSSQLQNIPMKQWQ